VGCGRWRISGRTATGWQIHLHEKGGKEHKMSCHHALSEMLHAYVAAAGIADDRKGWHQSRAQRDGADDESIGGMVHRPPAHSRGRHRRSDRQSHLPCDRHHELSGERSNTRRTWPRMPARARPNERAEP
jgi:hypothetical protein